MLIRSAMYVCKERQMVPSSILDMLCVTPVARVLSLKIVMPCVQDANSMYKKLLQSLLIELQIGPFCSCAHMNTIAEKVE